MLNPYIALAGGIALLAAAAGGFVKGQQFATAKASQAKLGQLVEALSERDAAQQRVDMLERGAARRELNRQTEVRSIYVEVPKIVDRPVYRNRCIDGDGVRLLDRAQAAAGGDRGAGPGAPAGEAGPAAADRAQH